MHYCSGIISWIFGGLILGGALPALSAWFGWVLLVSGAVLFLPKVWKLDTSSSSPAVALLVRGPYVTLGATLWVLALGTACVMVGSLTAAASFGEVATLAIASIWTYALGHEIASPVFRQLRLQNAAGRPQPLMFNVFEVVRGLGGRVTPAELAASHDVKYSDAKHALLELADQGACERIVARNGAVIFRFPELEGDKLDLLEQELVS